MRIHHTVIQPPHMKPAHEGGMYRITTSNALESLTPGLSPHWKPQKWQTQLWLSLMMKLILWRVLILLRRMERQTWKWWNSLVQLVLLPLILLPPLHRSGCFASPLKVA